MLTSAVRTKNPSLFPKRFPENALGTTQCEVAVGRIPVGAKFFCGCADAFPKDTASQPMTLSTPVVSEKEQQAGYAS